MEEIAEEIEAAAEAAPTSTPIRRGVPGSSSKAFPRTSPRRASGGSRARRRLVHSTVSAARDRTGLLAAFCPLAGGETRRSRRHDAQRRRLRPRPGRFAAAGERGGARAPAQDARDAGRLMVGVAEARKSGGPRGYGGVEAVPARHWRPLPTTRARSRSPVAGRPRDLRADGSGKSAVAEEVASLSGRARVCGRRCRLPRAAAYDQPSPTPAGRVPRPERKGRSPTTSGVPRRSGRDLAAGPDAIVVGGTGSTCARP